MKFYVPHHNNLTYFVTLFGRQEKSIPVKNEDLYSIYGAVWTVARFDKGAMAELAWIASMESPETALQ